MSDYLENMANMKNELIKLKTSRRINACTALINGIVVAYKTYGMSIEKKFDYSTLIFLGMLLMYSGKSYSCNEQIKALDNDIGIKTK